MMRQITDIKELRAIQMGALDFIHEFCEHNDYKYSLTGGTLIGAVRHKGYIPWDDDIDLYMMRSEYERFVKSFNDPSGRYEILYPGCGKKYFYQYAKVVDTRTLLVEDEVEGFSIGVYVDIFPVDYVPDNIACRKLVFKTKRILNKMLLCKQQPQNPFKSKAAYIAYKHFPLTVSCIERLLRTIVYRSKPAEFASNMTMAYMPSRCCFHASVMDKMIEMDFEDKRYKCMSGYDEYLTCMYGDYMQLPPEDQRLTHHFKAYYL